MSIKFCANLSFMFQEEASLIKRYALASGCGFKGVECAFPFDYSIEDVMKAKDNANVKQILINTPITKDGDGKFGLAAVPGKEDEFMDGVKLASNYAKALGCGLVHIMSGIVESPTENNLITYKRNLKAATSLLKQNNIVALIEPINRYSLPGYYMNCYSRALSVISEIGSDNLKLMLDVFHLQQICGNVSRNMKDMMGVVGHVQIAQVPERHEPNSAGELHYKYILDLLATENYTGWVGLEYKPASSTQQGLSWIHQFGYKL